MIKALFFYLTSLFIYDECSNINRVASRWITSIITTAIANLRGSCFVQIYKLCKTSLKIWIIISIFNPDMYIYISDNYLDAVYISGTKVIKLSQKVTAYSVDLNCMKTIHAYWDCVWTYKWTIFTRLLHIGQNEY